MDDVCNQILTASLKKTQFATRNVGGEEVIYYLNSAFPFFCKSFAGRIEFL